MIRDPPSFMRFPGSSRADRVPDARTIWLFREKLTKADAIETLRQAGYFAMGGQIVDASLIAAPGGAAPKTRRPRSSRAAFQKNGQSAPPGCVTRIATRARR